MEFSGIPFNSANDAIQHANASGVGTAIQVFGKCFVVAESEAHRLEAAGAGLAYLADHHGRIVTIPVN